MSFDSEVDLSKLSLLDRSFFLDEDVDALAQRLIGTILIFDNEEAGPVGGYIVETEAYDQNDPTAHCFKDGSHEASNGSWPMFLSGGNAYVFPTSYGYCLNFVTGKADFGSAVLIRALKPSNGQRIIADTERAILTWSIKKRSAALSWSGYCLQVARDIQLSKWDLAI